MKWIFHTRTRDPYLNLIILLLRITVAAMIMTHGWPKVERLLEGGEIRFGDPIGLGPGVSLVLSAFAEFICAIFIALGLATRLAAIPLIINMSVVAFIAHGPDPFSSKEMGLLYLLFFILFFVTGGGRYSLDYLLSQRRRR
jgi:putative oxidoreductase